jgi:hypothetical protein
MDYAIITWRTKAQVAEAMLLFPATESFKLPGAATMTAPNALFMFSPGESDTQPNKFGVALKRGMILQPYEPVICDIGECASLEVKHLVNTVRVPLQASLHCNHRKASVHLSCSRPVRLCCERA